MAINKVWIEQGCIAAGFCNEICPNVFELDDFGEAYITDESDYSANEMKIKLAAKTCPVKVIKFEEE